MTMRQNRINKIILTVLLFSLCNSCKDTGPINYQNSVITLKPQNLSLSTKEVSFNTPNAATSTFKVNTTNIEWEITGIPDWITVSPTFGTDNTTVTVTVTENTLTSNRIGILSFSSTDDSWSYSSPLTVSQYRATYYAIPDTDRIEFDGTASTASIRITSNIDDWSINMDPSMNWCTVSQDDGYINISVTPNSGSASRTGLIEIITIDRTEYVTILQRPAKISSTTDKLEFNVNGGTKTIEINTEAPWAVSKSCSWINVTPASGPAGNSTISVEVSANNSITTRADYIYLVLSESNKIEIPVSQGAIKFDIIKTELESLASGLEDTVAIESNTSWSVIGCPSWIQVTPDKGIGNGKVKVTITQNTEKYDRYDCIIISPDSIDYPFYIDVWQAAAITTDNGSMHFSDKSGSLYLSVYTELNWTAVPSDNWISLDAESGYGDTELKVTVTENTADTIRKGYVFITAENVQIKVLIEQQGKYLNIQSNALNFSSRGGSSQVTLKTNDSWTTTTSNDWISLQNTEGIGGCDITINVADNPSVSPRSGYVDFIPVNSKPVRLTVNQASRYLKVSPTTIHLAGKGNHPVSITISTDGTAQVTTQDSWLSISKESNTRYSISASVNENPIRTGTVTVSLTDLTNGTLSTSVTVTQDNKNEPFNNGHEYVDLGLSVMWATCNVDADMPEDFGGYYAWGEIETKDNYSWANYKYCKGSNLNLTKYNYMSGYGNNGYTDDKTILDPADDVAHCKWGSSWRMPTEDEFRELIDNCTWTWTGFGYKVSSLKSGYESEYIFLPAAGWVSQDYYNYGMGGWYWSSSLLSTTYPGHAMRLEFEEHSPFENRAPMYINSQSRSEGCSIRPVWK